jgi:hypothetical protein
MCTGSEMLCFGADASFLRIENFLGSRFILKRANIASFHDELISVSIVCLLSDAKSLRVVFITIVTIVFLAPAAEPPPLPGPTYEDKMKNKTFNSQIIIKNHNEKEEKQSFYHIVSSRFVCF